ncbi:MAG TPA: trypsin-like peptidase domain-containing protein [Gemmatimonadaceae bacterium]|nr:trypsin-like peptidase domain-containing protein [Gemmatimonadaceae bacterium]
MRARSVRIALVFAAGLACGVGLDSKQDSVATAYAQGTPATLAAAPGGGDPTEQVVIRVARQVSPAVVSVTNGPISGSGFFIRRDGVLLTNFHVVQGAERVQVGLADGRQFTGEVLGGDPQLDMAVIRIPLRDAPVAPLGNSDELQVGQTAIAIGNPLGLERTVTTGIVSAINRSPLGLQFGGLIQTDAAINPGNSGGPLLDSQGRVIGINTEILSPTGASIGVGFAIPINLANELAQQLLTTGHISYAYLGVGVADVYPEMARANNIPVEHGVIIGEIDRTSPAARAGLRLYDVITRLGDQAVDNSGDLRRLLREHRPGETIPVTVVRPPDGRRATLEVRLGEASP